MDDAVAGMEIGEYGIKGFAMVPVPNPILGSV